MTAGVVYCIDTSALMAGYKRLYPRHVFAGLWNRMGELIQQGRLIAPEEVFKELEGQDDDLTAWIKKNRSMFVAPDYYQTGVISQIAVDFPPLVRTGVSANRADPWVVAVAKTRGCIVVSEEKRGSIENPKIPQICRRYRVTHVPFLHIAMAEGWVFP